MKDIRTCDDGQSLTISNNECRDHDANMKMKSAQQLFKSNDTRKIIYFKHTKYFLFLFISSF